MNDPVVRCQRHGLTKLRVRVIDATLQAEQLAHPHADVSVSRVELSCFFKSALSLVLTTLGRSDDRDGKMRGRKVRIEFDCMLRRRRRQPNDRGSGVAECFL